jgi:two-component system KDP operon response regulator KdpE
LLRQVWGEGHERDLQYLRGYVRSLRQKVETDPSRPRMLTTEAGIGYRLLSLPIEPMPIEKEPNRE